MLDPTLDLEADLSIDSIKRTEIIGELALRLRLPGTAGAVDEAVVERLAKVKTLDGIVADVLAFTTDAVRPPEPVGTAAPGTSPSSPAPPTAPPPPPPVSGPVEPAAPIAERPTRHVVECAPLDDQPAGDVADPPTGAALRGRRVLVVEDGGGGVAWALTELLEAHGATVESRTRDRAASADDTAGVLAGTDTLVHLAALGDGQDPVLPAAFPLLRAALVDGVRQVFLGTAGGGHFGRAAAPAGPDPVPGAGLAGFARAAALEYPDRVVRVVDVDPKEEPDLIARRLLAELCRSRGGSEPDAPVVVGVPAGQRLTLRAYPEPLPELTPADRDTILRGRLGPDAVVLLTGGARGITALAALGLARATGCHIALLGRTGDDGEPEPAATAHAPDAPALRAALVATGLREPARIEAEVTRLLGRRQVRATLAAVAEHAASVRLHAADVADADAVRRVLADIADRHGRLDGIVHGAGVLEDRLLVDKSPESFRRVFVTKVDGARALVAGLRALRPTLAPPAFLAMFGSVAGVYGNRGQTDYAAANDALATLARHWSDESGAAPAPVAERVVTIDWGPWAATGGGMVTPELEREYARRGVALIDPGHGVDALLAELASGRARQAVYACVPTTGSVPA
ncbi:SDR family NAD(P)-dependent oxidoreductase [Embleya sp. NBC_00896]|uniref:SDR family NAD(P)-dependent oxidoreductase n=1 Tax=Embleya sp. NBC_00896 TaxID=2975961 RepID=UPI00386F8ADD